MLGDHARKHLKEATIMRYINFDENICSASWADDVDIRVLRELWAPSYPVNESSF